MHPVYVLMNDTMTIMLLLLVTKCLNDNIIIELPSWASLDILFQRLIVDGKNVCWLKAVFNLGTVNGLVSEERVL